MSTSTKILIGVAAVVVILGLWVTGTYNSLVGLDETAKREFSQIEVQYQRRMDLVPNLVATVQGSANFEKSTLESVTAARSAWAGAKTTDEKVTAANQFNSALSRLLVTVESYPNIKSTEAFIRLNDELAGTENRIQFARQKYNEAVRDYNATIRFIPGNIIASMAGFKAKSPFEAAQGAEKAPAVKFDFNNKK
jgi:LemA protein